MLRSAATPIINLVCVVLRVIKQIFYRPINVGILFSFYPEIPLHPLWQHEWLLIVMIPSWKAFTGLGVV